MAISRLATPMPKDHQVKSAGPDTSLARAQAKLAAGQLTATHLEELVHETRNGQAGSSRQRLLYLHAANPNIHSPLINSVLHEPVPGAAPQIDPLATPLPYNSVFDAILDGWRVLQFPDFLAPFADREIDMVGYEFILEKIEVYHG